MTTIDTPSGTGPSRPRDRFTERGDRRLAHVLSEHGWRDTDLDGLVEFWATRRQPGEGVAALLARFEVLHPAAPQVLSMNWGEGLLASGAADLFRPGGLARLRQLTGQPQGHPATPETVNGISLTASPSILATPVLNRPLLVPHNPCFEPPPVPPEAPVPTGCVFNPGHLLGRCLITGRLAAGSYGVVYRAMHRTLNIAVAVKVLHPELLGHNSQAAAQFRSEAMLLARINHPAIVRLWDFDDSVVPPYLVLEYVDGLNIASMIARGGPVPPGRAVGIALQVVDGLEAADRLGIIHRDIKPANILVTRDGRAKVADLGLAVVADLDWQFGHRAAGAAPLAGTVAYLAPELGAAAASADLRCDIYALGATLYHMLTGRLPFDGRSALEVLLKHAREPVTPPHVVNPAVGRRLSDAVVRMMAKSPAERFGSYAELRKELATDEHG